MDTETFRTNMWTYMEQHHADARIAQKSYGNSPWKYATVATFSQHRVEPQWYNHRSVLPEEIVADFDCDDSVMEEGVVKLSKRLSALNHNHSVWRTNGTESGGIHVHALYDIPTNVSDPKLLKTLLLKYLYDDPLLQGLDPQLTGNHLIRFEGGMYDKVPTWKAGRKTLIHLHGDPFQKNPIPQAVWAEYCSLVLKSRLCSLRRGRRIDPEHHTPLSIRFFLGDTYKNYRDGGKRGLFILASYYRKLPDEELWKLLRDFARYNCKEPVPDRVIKANIESVRKHQGRHVGERYRREVITSIGALKEVYGEKGEDSD